MYASTGQGFVGNNMFAYCLNNPVAYGDSRGTIAKICLTADGRIEDSPWRNHSPGGGGIIYHYDDTTTDCDVTEDDFWSTDMGVVIQSTIVGAGMGAAKGFGTSIPAALSVLPVSPQTALAIIASGTLTGLAKGAIDGFVGGIVIIIIW